LQKLEYRGGLSKISLYLSVSIFTLVIDKNGMVE